MSHDKSVPDEQGYHVPIYTCKYCLNEINKASRICTYCMHYQFGLEAFLRNKIGVWLPILGGFVSIVALIAALYQTALSSAAKNANETILAQIEVAEQRVLEAINDFEGLTPDEEDWINLELGPRFANLENFEISYFLDSRNKVILNGVANWNEPSEQQKKEINELIQKALDNNERPDLFNQRILGYLPDNLIPKSEISVLAFCRFRVEGKFHPPSTTGPPSIEDGGCRLNIGKIPNSENWAIFLPQLPAPIGSQIKSVRAVDLSNISFFL